MATNLPNNPAPVSGPGALSQRTDGGPGDKQPIRDVPGGDYGDRKEMAEIQGGADMYQQASAPPPPMPGDLFGASERPDEPITSGVPTGPGAGPAPRDVEDPYDSDMVFISQYLPALRKASESPNATNTFKSVVRYLETFGG
jgi:hypothetical protein